MRVACGLILEPPIKLHGTIIAFTGKIDIAIIITGQSYKCNEHIEVLSVLWETYIGFSETNKKL